MATKLAATAPVASTSDTSPSVHRNNQSSEKRFGKGRLRNVLLGRFRSSHASGSKVVSDDELENHIDNANKDVPTIGNDLSSTAASDKVSF